MLRTKLLIQTALSCGCGASELYRGDLCRVCFRRARLSVENFDGLREAALRRDGYQCQACGELERWRLLVHHRRPGCHELRWLITLCRACHVRIHRTWRPGSGFLALLRRLWREVNADLAEQRLLELVRGSSAGGEQLGLFSGRLAAGRKRSESS